MVSAAPARENGHEERARRIWLAVKRALLAIVAAIDREYGSES